MLPLSAERLTYFREISCLSHEKGGSSDYRLFTHLDSSFAKTKWRRNLLPDVAGYQKGWIAPARASPIWCATSDKLGWCNCKVFVFLVGWETGKAWFYTTVVYRSVYLLVFLNFSSKVRGVRGDIAQSLSSLTLVVLREYRLIALLTFHVSSCADQVRCSCWENCWCCPSPVQTEPISSVFSGLFFFFFPFLSFKLPNMSPSSSFGFFRSFSFSVLDGTLPSSIPSFLYFLSRAPHWYSDCPLIRSDEVLWRNVVFSIKKTLKIKTCNFIRVIPLICLFFQDVKKLTFQQTITLSDWDLLLSKALENWGTAQESKRGRVCCCFWRCCCCCCCCCCSCCCFFLLCCCCFVVARACRCTCMSGHELCCSLRERLEVWGKVLEQSLFLDFSSWAVEGSVEWSWRQSLPISADIEALRILGVSARMLLCT